MLDKLKGLINSVTGRMVLGVLVINILLAPLFSAGFLFFLRQGYQEDFIRAAQADIRFFATLLGREPNTQDLGKFTDALLGKDVVFVQILARDGTIGYEFKKPGIPTQYQEDSSFGQHGDGVFYTALPIYGNDRTSVRLGFDEASTTAQITAAYERGALLVIAYVILSLALVVFSGLHVTRSLRRLHKAAQKVASGDYSEQMDVPTTISEVTALGQDLEHMRWKLVKQSELMKHQALHDSLTGLANRRLLYDRTERALLTAKRARKSIAFFLLDLDRFKEINDTHGHHVGDQLLQQVAWRIRDALRESDTVARLGGDEFAILLPTTGEAQGAILVAERILRLFQIPFVLEQLTLAVGVSIGISLSAQEGESQETLAQRADVAMYDAKRTHSGYSIHHPALDQHTDHEHSMVEELRYAIEHDQLVLHYQPKVDLKTETVRSVEALVRWQHPAKGLLAPAEFLPLAEKSGLINPLTLWVAQESVRQCKAWHQAGLNIPVAVNLSARNLQNTVFPEQIGQLLQDLNVDATWLEFEINESAILLDPSRSLEVLRRLRLLGISIAIDDYGTATSSSLAALKRLPMHQIKIDTSFIADLADSNNAAIVRSAIDLAHSMGHTVIAEGVENRETLDKLKLMGCDMAQGYYMSPPVPAVDLVTWLKASTWTLTDGTRPLSSKLNE